VEVRRKIVIDLLQTENYAYADDAFATLVNDINKITDVHKQIALQKVNETKYNKALVELNKAIDYNKSNEEIWLLKCLVMDSLHNYENSIQCCFKAISCMYA